MARKPKAQPDFSTTFNWLQAQGSSSTLTLPEQIAEKVGNAIIKGHFEAGDRIQEQDLAAQFQVSRGPVREALRILEKEGMIQILPRRGAQVTQLNVEEVNNISEIRANLIALAVKLMTTRADKASLDQLKVGVDQLQYFARSNQADEFVNSVYRLSALIAEASGNPHLRNILFSLAHQTIRYSRLGFSTEKRRHQSAKNWRTLSSAILQGDARGAQRAVEQMVNDTRETAIQLLQEEQSDQGTTDQAGRRLASA
jgi:DNA-binding GntR family transcriptional regulator